MEFSSNKRLGVTDKVRVFFRSLTIGASWNYSKMQNIGFAYAITPVTGSSRETNSDVLVRHTESFSTNPCMSSLIAASTLKLEEANLGSEALRLKQSLAGPYAALGDPFFWGSLRPASSILGVCVALLGSFLAPLALLVFYNIFHGYIRLAGFVSAYRDGMGAMSFLKKLEMPDNGKTLRWVSVFLLALLAGSILSLPVPLNSMLFFGMLDGIIVLACIALCYVLIVGKVSLLLILYSFSVVILVAAGLICD